jgi:hypothetical protein
MIVYSYLKFRNIRHDEAPEDRPDSGPTVARLDNPIE